jgi:hypothetical protein
MPEVPDDSGRLADCEDHPGKAVRAVAEKLAARGIRISGPEREGSRRPTITSAERARCELTIEGGGSVRWDYRPRAGRGADPAEMIALVLRVLGAADGGHGDPVMPMRPGLSLKGAVGRALVAHGLKVGLEVFEDPAFYAVAAEIVVTNPARPERGQVSVSDDGDVTWEYCYRDGSDADQMADAVVSVFTYSIAGYAGTAVPR